MQHVEFFRSYVILMITFSFSEISLLLQVLQIHPLLMLLKIFQTLTQKDSKNVDAVKRLLERELRMIRKVLMR